MQRSIALVALVAMAGLSLAALGCSGGSSAEGSCRVPVGGVDDSALLAQLTQGALSGISVAGTGKAFGTPDVAILSLGVSTQASTVAEANRQAQEAMDKLLSALRSNGVDEKDIQTHYFGISPQYGAIGSPDAQPQISG